MPVEQLQSNKPYLTVIQGKLAQKVDENTPNAVRREYELKDGTKGVKWVLYFKSVSGLIHDLKVKETDFGQALDIVFSDYVLSLNTESRYFADFVKKIKSGDINQDIKLSPFDFESEGKRIVGMGGVIFFV